MGAKCDFSGWATKNDLRCSDGRTIRRDAFKHIHNDPDNVLGHAVLFNKPEGVRFDAFFNDSDKAKQARLLVEHGDITSVSIYANQLKQQGGNVLHGTIRELSLVLAGANPGALIDMPIAHGDEEVTEAFIYTGETFELSHSDSEETQPESEPEEKEVLTHSEEDNMAGKDKTVQEVFDTLNEEQKTVVYALLGEALSGKGGDDNDEEDDEVKHNVFDTEENDENTLTHDAMNAIITDAKRYGSMKDSYLAHEEEYGIDGIEWLFPEDKELNNPPKFIDRDQTWVSTVMNGVHHTPFSRVKSSFANITEDEARAKGYMKKGYKKEEVFSLLKRSTSPQTIYKKQKLDRDDVVDITDFDVVAWIRFPKIMYVRLRTMPTCSQSRRRLFIRQTLLSLIRLTLLSQLLSRLVRTIRVLVHRHSSQLKIS